MNLVLFANCFDRL